MKKLILLFALFPLLCSAQIEFPLVKEGGIWREVYMGFNPPSYEITYVFNQFLIQGDTIIDSLVYKNVFETNYSSSLNSLNFIGAIRETPNGKVWYIRKAGSSLSGPFCYNGPTNVPVLLYDFSLELGDTFNVYDAGLLLRVNSIDSVLIDGHWRKRWYYNGPDFGLREVIEGIGDTKGLFFPYCYEFESSQILSCYEDSNAFWLNPEVVSMGADCYSVGINESKKLTKSININIFPNPISNELNIEIESGFPKNSIITIYDAIGNILLKQLINSNDNLVNIDLSSYNSGMYFYRIIGDNGVVGSGKCLKI